jgi:hypothetical protein
MCRCFKVAGICKWSAIGTHEGSCIRVARLDWSLCENGGTQSQSFETVPLGLGQVGAPSVLDLVVH